jgi:hypothetical protein
MAKGAAENSNTREAAPAKPEYIFVRYMPGNSQFVNKKWCQCDRAHNATMSQDLNVDLIAFSSEYMAQYDHFAA